MFLIRHGYIGLERIAVHSLHSAFRVCLPAPPSSTSGFCYRYVSLTLRSLSFPIECIDLMICAKFLIFVSWVLSLLSLELKVSCFVVVI